MEVGNEAEEEVWRKKECGARAGVPKLTMVMAPCHNVLLEQCRCLALPGTTILNRVILHISRCSLG